MKSSFIVWATEATPNDKEFGVAFTTTTLGRDVKAVAQANGGMGCFSIVEAKIVERTPTVVEKVLHATATH